MERNRIIRSCPRLAHHNALVNVYDTPVGLWVTTAVTESEEEGSSRVSSSAPRNGCQTSHQMG